MEDSSRCPHSAMSSPAAMAIRSRTCRLLTVTVLSSASQYTRGASAAAVTVLASCAPRGAAPLSRMNNASSKG